jgi:hypothetical protein
MIWRDGMFTFSFYVFNTYNLQFLCLPLTDWSNKNTNISLSLFNFYTVLPLGIYCVVYDSIYDASFKIESLRKLRSHLNNSSNEVYLKFENFVTSFAALIASLLSWSLILPLDVVKTNLQAETNPNIHKNMVECLLMLIRTHNHKALFSGLYMNIAKSYATILGFQYCLNKCQKHVLENKQ